MTQELDRNQCVHERPQKFFQGGTSKFYLTFQVAHDKYKRSSVGLTIVANIAIATGPAILGAPRPFV